VDSHSYLCKYQDRSHIQTHLSPDREESGEDPVEENVTRQLLFSLLSVLYVFSVFSYVSVFLLANWPLSGFIEVI
jgi:hypothetical protein